MYEFEWWGREKRQYRNMVTTVTSSSLGKHRSSSSHTNNTDHVTTITVALKNRAITSNFLVGGLFVDRTQTSSRRVYCKQPAVLHFTFVYVRISDFTVESGITYLQIFKFILSHVDPLLGNDCVIDKNTRAVTFANKHVCTATIGNNNRRKVFSGRSVPRLL
jgi:hypothetical protein